MASKVADGPRVGSGLGIDSLSWKLLFLNIYQQEKIGFSTFWAEHFKILYLNMFVLLHQVLTLYYMQRSRAIQFSIKLTRDVPVFLHAPTNLTITPHLFDQPLHSRSLLSSERVRATKFPFPPPKSQTQHASAILFFATTPAHSILEPAVRTAAYLQHSPLHSSICCCCFFICETICHLWLLAFVTECRGQ